MKLRNLKIEDAPFMLEWMHDDSVVHDLKADFASKTLQDCKNFIIASRDTDTDYHLAIVDDNDKYMGTVSLKHIENGVAEFGITVRKCAMGKGYSYYAMSEIIKIGKRDKNLYKIYWCVDPKNLRAIRFYDKHLFNRICAPDEARAYTEEEKKRYVWYEA